MTTIQFVSDMVTDSPTVLLDLNVSPFNLAPGFDFSAAAFEKAWTSNPLQHGTRQVRSVANRRELTVPLQVVSATAAGFANAIEDLGQAISANSFLKVQFNNSVRPVFLRTFADPDYAAEVRGILKCAVQYQVVTLTISTDPFAYGPRIEVTNSPFTVSNDPANGTNPMRFDVTGIIGDVVSPAIIVATSTAVTGTPSGLAGKWTHLATRSRGTPSNYANVIQAEGMTLGNGATVTADATMSGGSKIRVTPGLTAMTLRLSDTFPANGVSVVDARGEYRVYARVAKSVASDTWDLQLSYGASSTAPVLNDVQRLPANLVGPYYVDLGFVPCPAWSDPINHGYSGIAMKVQLPFVGLYAQRVGGSGSLDVDFLYFVPADESTLIASWPADLQVYAVDGTTDAGGSCYATVAALDEIITTSGPAQITGLGFPQLVPAATNRIHLVREVDPSGSVDPIFDTTTIHVYYWPRWRGFTRP